MDERAEDCVEVAAWDLAGGRPVSAVEKNEQVGKIFRRHGCARQGESESADRGDAEDRQCDCARTVLPERQRCDALRPEQVIGLALCFHVAREDHRVTMLCSRRSRPTYSFQYCVSWASSKFASR